MQLDSHAPSIPIHDFIASEERFTSLERTDPERAAELDHLLQDDADESWSYYQQLSDIHRREPASPGDHPTDHDTAATTDQAGPAE